MERVGDVGHGPLERQALGKGPDEGEEVRQLPPQLALPASTEPAEVLGREDVADEGDREGDQQRDR